MAPVASKSPLSALDKRKRHDENVDKSSSSDSDSDIGPAPPAAGANEPAPKRPRVIGPSLPPPSHNDRAHADDNGDSESSSEEEEEEDDDDDDFGPSLPPNGTTSAETTTPTVTHTEGQRASTGMSEQQQPQTRDDWMLVPPSGGDWTARVDPTKLKSRRFHTGKGAKGPSSSGAAAETDSWHETPQEKQARLQREIMGIKATTTSAAAVESSHSLPSNDIDRDTARRLQEYNKSRGPSMYEAHQKKKNNNNDNDQQCTAGNEKDDDPSARAFDREKDIGGGSQINATRRREMVKKASDFSTRFSSAKYL